MGFQEWLAHLSPSWLVNKSASFFQHLAEQGEDEMYIVVSMVAWSTIHIHIWEYPWGGGNVVLFSRDEKSPTL